MSSTVDVLVVGGGAAGIIAARRAAECGAKVLLLEKNQRLGMKILISGGGKCNLTHDGPMETLRLVFRPNEARFLKPAFYRYSNLDFLKILHDRGLATYVRPDGRIFPIEPANAKTVVAVLTRYLVEAGVQVRCNAPVTGICVEGDKAAGVIVADELILAGQVVIATGGSSYPATGTTGDGWHWLSEIGHTLVPLRAALAPIYLAEAHPEWSGLALRDILLRVRTRAGGKEIARWSGDLLFTHKGISGPTALGVSREIADLLSRQSADERGFLEVDLASSLEYEELKERVKLDVHNASRRTMGTIVAPYAPSRLIEPLLNHAGLTSATRAFELPAKWLTRLVSVLKAFPLGSVLDVPLERGEVVAGGVALDEVDFRTMRSLKVGRLYLCGEILDIAGPVGGYNLQAAWSTGYVAGESAGAYAAPS